MMTSQQLYGLEETVCVRQYNSVFALSQGSIVDNRLCGIVTMTKDRLVELKAVSISIMFYIYIYILYLYL